MIDTYTKVVLTVIAACLVVLVARQTIADAGAQFGLGCDGSPQAPCFVRLLN